MGKQGPCGHCGIATTPLWRNGPPEKPVLCNACGSRWRTKGTLQNYMPMHSGGFGGSVSPEGSVVGRGRKTGHKSHSEPRPHKRKEPSGGHQERGPLRSQLPFLKAGADDSISTSSLSSYVSGSEDGTPVISSLVQSDFSASSSPWEGRVPSRKRTSMVRSCTSVDKLIRQFQELLCEDSAGRSSLTSESPEDILVDSKPSTMTDEIGLGSVFIRQPMIQEHRGEIYNDSGEPSSMDILPSEYVGRQIGGPLTQLPNGAEYLTSIRGKEKAKQGKKLDGGGWILDDRHISPKSALLENFPYNKRDVLQSCQSPLVLLELKDVINFDTFTGLLTEQEQGQLLKSLSSEDAVNNSESLKEMFSSAQFEASLANFQHLLSESMFEPSAVGVNPHVLQHYQQLQTLTDLTSSGWMEQCLQFHSRNRRRGGSADFSKSKELNKERLKGSGLPFMRSASPGHKQSPGRSSGQFGAGVHEDINSHMGVFKQGGGPTNYFLFGVGMAGKAASEPVNLDTGSSSNDTGFGFDAGGSCYDGNSLLPTDRICGIGSKDDLPDLHSPGSDETEADLLFNIPTHMMPFQDTDLLQQPVWAKSKKEVEANQIESSSLFGSNIWHLDTSSPSELFWNPTCASLNGTSVNPGRLLT